MSYARSPRGVSSTTYGTRFMAQLLWYSATEWLRLQSSRATCNCPVARASGARMEVVEREVTIPAPPAAVWGAMTRSDEVSAWFGADAELDVRPGGRGVFRW